MAPGGRAVRPGELVTEPGRTLDGFPETGHYRAAARNGLPTVCNAVARET